jgi:hypothetical protein
MLWCYIWVAGRFSKRHKRYIHHGSIFKYIKRHVSLKELELGLIRGQIVPFLREKRPFKKSTKNYNAASGIIAGELLVR